MQRSLNRCWWSALSLAIVATLPLIQASAQSDTRSVSPDQRAAMVIRSYAKDLVGVRAANPTLTLHVDRDASLANEPVLFVDYPPPSDDPAARDIHVDAENRNWSGAGAIAFRVKAERSIKLSVSFIDRNRVVYTTRTQLQGGAWQSIRIAFDEIHPNPYFQPPDAKRGAPIDLSEVNGIAFAPQDSASGRFAISQFVLSKR